MLPHRRMLMVDILEDRGRRESQSAVDGVLRCCRSAGTVQTGTAVPCRVDTVVDHDAESERDALGDVKPM